jgi:SAM-dependent methyltransferase
VLNSLRKTLFKFYYRAECIIAPDLRNAQFPYCEALKSILKPETRWLDIGCGRRIFPEWMPGADEEQFSLCARLKATFGLDPDLASLRDNRFVQYRVVGNAESLPFSDSSFDILTANMVVEHVSQPRALLSEVHRVLRPNGIFLFHTPNALSYATLIARVVPEGIKGRLVEFFDGRIEQDVFRTFYRINTPAQVEELSRAAGFRVLELRRVESSGQAVMLGPLVILELLWIRLLRLPSLRNLRSNLIVMLQKSTM